MIVAVLKLFWVILGQSEKKFSNSSKDQLNISLGGKSQIASILNIIFRKADQSITHLDDITVLIKARKYLFLISRQTGGRVFQQLQIYSDQLKVDSRFPGK